ncbi:MAG: hypothetical protein JWO60_1056 [Frankiales bacterium]|nr:hypothetical protein [Frankiales bacterium]
MTTAIRDDSTTRLGTSHARHLQQDAAPHRSALTNVGLVGLRLALAVEFLWAFLDKLFGWGYATPSERAWIHGGSPTSGFLSGVSGGPLKGFFRSLAGVEALDWLFMAGLLGIGAALLLGVALRPAAVSGVLLLTMMWFATWPPATLADGEPTHSTNPLVDDHVISAFALVVVALLAGRSAGYLGRRWNELSVVRAQPWLR